MGGADPGDRPLDGLGRSCFVAYRRCLDLFRATAARTSAFNAFSFISSPSRKSMARRVLPSRLELKRREGSGKAAPLANVIFTTLF